MKLLVTHRSPDLDAIGAVWMFRRFHAQEFADAKLYFVNAGDSIDPRSAVDLGFSLEEVVHVDTGLGEFDHHQPERGMQHICATSLVYEYVSHLHPELTKNEGLRTLVQYITDIDHFAEQSWPNPTDSKYQLMIHSLIEGFRNSVIADDEASVQFGSQCLDAALSVLEKTHEAAKEIESKGKEFETVWGKGLAISSSNDEVIKLAQKSGYVVVVRKDPQKGDIRIKAVPKKDIDLTAIANAIMKKDTVGYWYFHPAKTMLLNGSKKDDGNRKASPLSLQEVIECFEKK